MKKGTVIAVLFFALFLVGLGLLITSSLENGALVIAGVICICTAFLIVSIATVFLKDGE